MIASDDASLKAQTKQREAEHKDYIAESTDYAESIDALDRAIMVLSKQNYDRKQAAGALLQLSTNQQVPEDARRAIATFLEMSSGSDLLAADYAPPEANAYEFQSGGIIDMLKKLKDEFRDKKKQCEVEEMNSRHAFEMIEQDLTDSIEEAKADAASKTIDKDQLKEYAAEQQKELSQVTAGHAEDVKFLSDFEAECSEKSLSFKEKQDLRTAELVAIEKAIEILSSAAVQDAGAKHLGLAQTGASLLQIGSRWSGSSVESEEGIRKRLRDFLAAEAGRLRSAQLGLLAQRSVTDPFVKVRKLIEDMIERLLEEANQEAEQKGFCDKELGTNKQTRNKLQSEIDELQASIDEATATITQLTEDIARLTEEVSALDAAMTNATDMRTAEKEKNTLTITEAKDAQQAIADAKQVH